VVFSSTLEYVYNNNKWCPETLGTDINIHCLRHKVNGISTTMTTIGVWPRRSGITGVSLHAALALTLSLLCTALDAAESKAVSGRAYFDKQYYEEAAPLLERAYQRTGNLTDARLLGTTYYHLLDFEHALPLFSRVVKKHPSDIPSRLMLAEILLTLKRFKEADPHIAYLQVHARDQFMSWILIARQHVSRKETDKAIASYEYACRLNPDASVHYSLELLMLYIEKDDQSRAKAFARQVIHRSPDAFEVNEIKVRLEAMEDLARQSRFRDSPYTVQLGYLLEHDNYLLVEPDRLPSTGNYRRESDFRHVLTFKATGKHSLGESGELYAEANLYQSLHNHRDEYDQLRQNYLAGIHWSSAKYGLRLPFSYSHSDLDKHFYHQSSAFTPELYLCLDRNSTLHGMLRLQLDDYQDGKVAEEQRSGKSSSLSVLYHHSFHHERVQGNYMYTLSNSNSDGDNWDYREQLLSAYLSYYYSKRVVGRLFFSQGQQDFDNIHSSYGVSRNDRYTTTSVNLAYWLNRNLELVGNWMWSDRSSNIELYDYTRQVAGIGANWHF